MSMHAYIRHACRATCGLIAMACAFQAIAQDDRFSLMSATPLLLDPALAGALHDREAGFMHRDQWNATGDPFRTDALHGDTELGAAVAANGVQDIARQARRVNTDKNIVAG